MRTKIQSGLILAAFTIATALGGMTAQAKDHGGGAVVVTPANMQGWSCVPPQADTRPGGNATFIVDPTAPSGAGALQLTTDLTTTAKVQCVHSTNTLLTSIRQLSYWTKQNLGSPPVADPAYELATCLTGVTATGCAAQKAPGAGSSFATLVFEPYQNGVVIPGAWQYWDVAAGRFWSTRTVVCSNGVVAGTPGGPATYTLAQLQTMCPEAVVFQYLVNVGTNNPGYNVETDLFNFNGTVYDFEPFSCGKDKGGKQENTSKQCKDRGDDNNDNENQSD